ncbi:mitochondrial phosphate carrier protein [Linnemannia gamsii]|uniref:Mitochondrial phosphate carrier protein n=1 Tax=Linnemannia gamsii TaxID=64522 RepID=A0A9P6UJF0_9FUNG|nr:mitochondrial phosphate carrier protein [Linnemannia gamsii]
MLTTTNPPFTPTGVALYARFGLAGAIGCGVTHGVLTPVDVVKTRIQLDPVTYNKGMAGTFRQVIRTEGVEALMTGFGPTFAGYFLQGALKFGGYEFWKKTLIDSVGQENAARNRTAIYLVGAAIAEFIADIALCPLEATRIRLVSQPTFANGLVSGITRLVKEEGVYRGLYSGFGPIVFKQVPYTMSKFVVYEVASEALWRGVGDPKQMTSSTTTAVNLTAGLIAGVVAAVVSQPADTLLSKINKAKGNGSIISRLSGLASDLGFRGLFLGLGPRIMMVGLMSAFQFAIYGDLKRIFGATSGVEIRK